MRLGLPFFSAAAVRGNQAEQLAARYLQQQGLSLIQTNYRCRFGEIDLIMREGDELVFVEVRLRGNSAFGGAAESISALKQQKLARAAQHYQIAHGFSACRFDAVLFDELESGRCAWVKNAFECAWN